MDEAQWDLFLQRLLDASRAAIQRFAAEHPTDEVCYFAFDSEPRYGYVITCFNTSYANLRHVREWHEKQVAYRKKLLAQPVWRDHAYYQMKANSVSPFCNNTGDFAYQDFAEVRYRSGKHSRSVTIIRKRRTTTIICRTVSHYCSRKRWTCWQRKAVFRPTGWLVRRCWASDSMTRSN